jgi:uncharacterized protein YndB with AHSA1/START domain
MAKKPVAQKINGIGDDAVRAKTGKDWAGWLAALDRAGAAKMSHKEIAAFLAEKFECPPWWSQMVTVGYEQARGLREKHQKPDGYTASASKTIAVPVARLFAAWSNERARSRWLPGADLHVRKATPPKSLRAVWAEGKSKVTVDFYAKGEGKSQVAVQHDKLASRKEVDRMKAYWGEALDRLKEQLAGAGG